MNDAPRETAASVTSAQVRARLVEALKLDLVGPWAGHALAEERLPGWVRPSNWYLTGFLIPSGTPPEKCGDADEDDDSEEIPESAGLAEESNEERKAAKKGFFPSSMGLSFLVPKESACSRRDRALGRLCAGRRSRGGTASPCPSGNDIRARRQSPWRSRERAIRSCTTSRTRTVSNSTSSSGRSPRRISQSTSRGHPIGLGLPGEPPHSGRPEKESPTSPMPFSPRSRCGANSPSCRDRTCAGHQCRGLGRAGGRPSLRRHAGVRDRPRRLGRVGDRGRRVPSASHGVDPERRGGEDRDRGRAGRRAFDGGAWSARGWCRCRARAAASRDRVPHAGSRRRRADVAALQGARRETAEELLRVAGVAADRIERGIAVLAAGRRRPRRLPRGEPRRGAGAAQAARASRRRAGAPSSSPSSC